MLDSEKCTDQPGIEPGTFRLLPVHHTKYYPFLYDVLSYMKIMSLYIMFNIKLYKIIK